MSLNDRETKWSKEIKWSKWYLSKKSIMVSINIKHQTGGKKIEKHEYTTRVVGFECRWLRTTYKETMACGASMVLG